MHLHALEDTVNPGTVLNNEVCTKSLQTFSDCFVYFITCKFRKLAAYESLVIGYKNL